MPIDIKPRAYIRTPDGQEFDFTAETADQASTFEYNVLTITCDYKECGKSVSWDEKTLRMGKDISDEAARVVTMLSMKNERSYYCSVNCLAKACKPALPKRVK